MTRKLLLVALLVVALLVTPALAATISAHSTTAYVGQAPKEVNIVLDSAPAGLSGYDITVSVSDPALATIAAANKPGWATIGVPVSSSSALAVMVRSTVPAPSARTATVPRRIPVAPAWIWSLMSAPVIWTELAGVAPTVPIVAHPGLLAAAMVARAGSDTDTVMS